MEHKIWNERYRPTIIDNFIGDPSLKESVRSWIDKGDFPNLIFYGKAGSGKTTIAKMLAKSIECDYKYINCSDENGIDVVRDKVKTFAGSASFKPIKIVIMDEADFLSINAQASLRAIIENYSMTTRFIFTCNFIERVIEPLRSRLSPIELNPPTRLEVAKHISNILDKENIKYDLGDAALVIHKFYPDIRKCINIIQTCCIDGELKVDEKKFSSQLPIQLLLDELKSKSPKAFNNIRQMVADSELNDFTETYRSLYENLTSAEQIIIISESMYQSVTFPDKEICFMACIAKLLQL